MDRRREAIGPASVDMVGKVMRVGLVGAIATGTLIVGSGGEG